MQTGKQSYQSFMDKVYQWLSEAAEHDAVTLYEVVEKVKAYMNAAGRLGADEIALLERYLKRDVEAFTDQMEQQADQSLWLASLKSKMASLLADMSDKNRLQLFEMNVDVDHSGEYKVGEVVALGELVCISCGHRHPVDFVETIEPCVVCEGEVFSRNTDIVEQGEAESTGSNESEVVDNNKG